MGLEPGQKDRSESYTTRSGDQDARRQETAGV